MLPDFGQISASPASHEEVVSHLTDLARESRASRDKWASQADKNNIVYLHGEYPAPPATKRVINPIQNAILADVVIQTREKIGVTLEPVETGDPGEIYLADPAMQPVDPLTGQATPIDPAIVQAMQQPQPVTDELGQPMMDEMGQPMAQPGAPDAAFIKVDDKLSAEVWQAVFDRMWKRSKVDGWVKRSLTSNEIHGWMVALYEWDDDGRRHRLRPMSVWQAYLDPTEESLDEMSYAGIDVVLDADEAIKLYPTFAAQIREMAKDGQPSKPDSESTLGRADMDYERKVVTLRVFWLRNQPFPMSEDEAVQSGRVEQREVFDVSSGIGTAAGSMVERLEASAGSQMDPAGDVDPAGGDGLALAQQREVMDVGIGQPLPADQGAETPAGPAEGQSGAGGDPSGAIAVREGGAIDDGVSGQLGTAPPPGAEAGGLYPVPRLAYFSPGTDAEVTPDSPDWPTRFGIRQLTVIESVVVDDRECEHADIPLLHNVNRPIPGRPWGIGEPAFLMNAQKAYNSLVDGMVEYAEFFKNPASAAPESVAARLEKEFGTAHVDPGTMLRIPDELLMNGQKLGDFYAFYQPPPISDAPMQMSELLKRQINEQSGHTDAIRGILPSAQTSGKAVELLQESGTSMIQHKSQATEAMIERLANLMHFSHVWRLELPEIRQIVSKYPDYVLEAVIRRGRQSEWDISVEVASGTGAVIAAKKQEAVQAFQVRDPATGEPLQGIETTRQALKIDHIEERQRWEMDAARMAAAMAQGQSQDESGKGGKPDKGGSVSE
jgi:hypothetical protein